MDVKTLIKLLKTMDQNAQVVVNDNGYDSLLGETVVEGHAIDGEGERRKTVRLSWGNGVWEETAFTKR